MLLFCIGTCKTRKLPIYVDLRILLYNAIDVKGHQAAVCILLIHAENKVNTQHYLRYLLK